MGNLSNCYIDYRLKGSIPTKIARCFVTGRSLHITRKSSHYYEIRLAIPFRFQRITRRREGGTGSVYENTLRTPTTKPTKLAEEREVVSHPAVFILKPLNIILAEIFPGLHFNNYQIFGRRIFCAVFGSFRNIQRTAGA